MNHTEIRVEFWIIVECGIIYYLESWLVSSSGKSNTSGAIERKSDLDLGSSKG